MLTALLLALLAAGPRTLDVAFWNLESPGHANEAGTRPSADIDFLAERIGRDFQHLDLAGFEEVDPTWPPRLEQALEAANPGKDFTLVTSGRPLHDQVALAYDRGRFEQVGLPHTVPGIEHPAPGEISRPALYLQLRDKEGGEEFLFMVNHLARSTGQKGIELRKIQARRLREWAARQTLPVVMGGDFNFDLPLTEDDPEGGFTTLTAYDVLHWARPLVLTETTRHGQILDFVFTTADWDWEAEILPNDYLPVERNSDHRPIRARFEL